MYGKNWIPGVLIVLIFIIAVASFGQDSTSAEPEKEPTTWQGVVYFLGFLLLSNVGMWIREWKKHGDFKKKNGYMIEMKNGMKEVKTEVGEVKSIATDTKGKVIGLESTVEQMNIRCTSHERVINQNSQAILDIAKGD